MAAAAGDGAGAFAAVRRMAGAGVPPRLRSFSPALAAFAHQGQVLTRLSYPGSC